MNGTTYNKSEQNKGISADMELGQVTLPWDLLANFHVIASKKKPHQLLEEWEQQQASHDMNLVICVSMMQWSVDKVCDSCLFAGHDL